MVEILRIRMSRIYNGVKNFGRQYQSQHFSVWYFKAVGWLFEGKLVRSIPGRLNKLLFS